MGAAVSELGAQDACTFGILDRILSCRYLRVTLFTTETLSCYSCKFINARSNHSCFGLYSCWRNLFCLAVVSTGCFIHFLFVCLLCWKQTLFPVGVSLLGPTSPFMHENLDGIE